MASAEKPSLSHDSLVTAALVAGAFVAGQALQLTDRHLSTGALTVLTAGMLLTALAALGGSRVRVPRSMPLFVPAVMLGALAVQLAELVLDAPDLTIESGSLALFRAGILLAGALTVVMVWLWPRWGIWTFALVLVVHLALGVFVIRSAPAPPIDIWQLQQNAVDALLHGQSPYSMPITSIHASPGQMYGPYRVIGGQAQAGSLYPPLGLVLALPGYVLGGDTRYSNLVAMALAAICLVAARPGRWSALAAALYLFMPRSFVVLAQGWAEPTVVLGLGAVLLAAARFRRELPYVLGLWLAAQPHALLALPLIPLLLGPGRWRDTWGVVWRAGLVALVVTAPLALADPRGLTASVIAFPVEQSFRRDSLSYLAVYRAATGNMPPTWIGLALVVPATALALWRIPRGPGGFALGVGFVTVVFFAFSKRAFGNDYFVVAGYLWCALALAAPTTARVTARLPARRPALAVDARVLARARGGPMSRWGRRVALAYAGIMTLAVIRFLSASPNIETPRLPEAAAGGLDGTRGNLAQVWAGGRARVSSYDGHGHHHPMFAIDAEPDPEPWEHWQSEPGDEAPWVEVDLGNSADVDSVVLSWPAERAGAGLSLECWSGSRRVGQTRRVGAPTGVRSEIDVDCPQVDRVRVTFDSSGEPASLVEIEVWGRAVSP